MTVPAAGDDADADIVVTDATAASRYEVRVNDELAGFADYAHRDGRVVFPHAEVYPQFGGRGVGTALARWALDDVIAQGKLITPRCPFIVEFIRRNPSYVAHVDDKSRGRFQTGPPES
jgi:uncharacterized protein